MLSRIARLRADKKDDEYQPEMPPVEAGYLLNYFYEIGPIMSGGTSPVPITHGEIESWKRISGIELTSWEARTLRRLSVDYLIELQEAKDIDSEAPWDDAEDVIEAQNYKAESLRESMRALAVL